MSFYLIVSAIVWLAPAQPHETVKTYADLIRFEARWYDVDPMLVVAIIQVESGWNARKRSKTNDYGLMQVHVARRGSSNFWRREKELYDPRTNIREGTRLLAMWKRYHETWCKGDHPHWAHYKWGKKVGEISHALKVLKLRNFLARKFRPKSDRYTASLVRAE